jgi:integrase
VEQAAMTKQAVANAIPFGRVCDSYRDHLKQAGKQYDRAESLIANIEAFFGRHRDAATIGWDEYQQLLAEVRELAPQTQRHYASTLIAMLNFAVAHRVLPAQHALGKVPRPVVVKSDAPVTWTKKELAVILGPAMDEYEREQARWNARVEADKSARGLRSPSVVPLRGFCYVAYFTLMRPKNNFALTWQELLFDCDHATFRLDVHKNVNKGIRAEGPIAEQLLRYLRSIHPGNASGPVHVNPATGAQYVDVRKQWNRLIVIASRMIGYALEGRKADFFTFRHTGASHLAEKTKNPILIVKMMGDTNVQTVMQHYFNLDLEFMAEMVSGWVVPAAEKSGRTIADDQVTN